MNGKTNEPLMVDVNGHRLAYHRSGQGPAALLIHGIPTSSYLWRGVAPRLISEGVEVLTIDLLGYGASDKAVDTDLGIAAQADLLAEALKRLGWPGGALVGHDIGGGIAQLLCVGHGVDVEKLILVDTIAYDSFPEPGIARLKDPAWDAILGAPDFDLRKGLTKGFSRGMVRGERVTPEMIAAYERPFHGVDGRLAYLRAARALRTEELSSKADAIEQLDLPTLIVWGAEDAFQPIAYGARLASAMPNAKLHVVEHAGHFLPEDEPELLACLIGDFLKGRTDEVRNDAGTP